MTHGSLFFINNFLLPIASESSTSPAEFIMATMCKICAGPIEPPDQHDHCFACLGLAHAEAVLDESDCGHCADLPARVLRTRRDVVRGLFGVRPTACSVSDVLCFLQYRLDSGCLPSTLKVYVAGIASFRSPLGRQTISRHVLVVSFLKGVRRLHEIGVGGVGVKSFFVHSAKSCQ